MSNVIEALSNKLVTYAAELQKKLDELPAEKVAQADAIMAIDFEEHYAYQNAKSRAQAMGTIDHSMAQTVYAALGAVHTESNGGWAEGTSTAMKLAVSRLMLVLLKP